MMDLKSFFQKLFPLTLDIQRKHENDTLNHLAAIRKSRKKMGKRKNKKKNFLMKSEGHPISLDALMAACNLGY